MTTTSVNSGAVSGLLLGPSNVLAAINSALCELVRRFNFFSLVYFISVKEIEEGMDKILGSISLMNSDCC